MLTAMRQHETNSALLCFVFHFAWDYLQTSLPLILSSPDLDLPFEYTFVYSNCSIFWFLTLRSVLVAAKASSDHWLEIRHSDGISGKRLVQFDHQLKAKFENRQLFEEISSVCWGNTLLNRKRVVIGQVY